MKIQRTPIILFAIAAALGGFVYFHEILGAPKREAAQEQSKKLFPFEEGDIQAFTLKTQERTLAFKRAPANQPSPQPTAQPSPSPTTSPSPTASPSPSPTTSQSEWRMTSPKTAQASDSSVAYLLNLLGTGSSDRSITVPAAQQAEFGFDRPLATVDIALKDQKTHRLIIGKPDFNRSNLYAQVNPPENTGTDVTVQLISMDFESAVTRPLSEWEAKPPTPAQSNQPTLPSPSPTTR